MDDGAAASTFKNIMLFFERLRELGPAYGYFPEDDSTFSTFVQQEDLHLLQVSPFFLQEHLMLEHLDFRLQLQQPTKRSPLFDFFVGGDFVGDGTIGVSSTNALA